MIDKSIFPADVQEVLDWAENGEFLNGLYREKTDRAAVSEHRSGRVGIVKSGPFAGLEEALRFEQDQDLEPPYVFLQDIVDDAAGDIPPAADGAQKELARALIFYEEEQDFPKKLMAKLAPLAAENGLKAELLAALADKIGSELYQCAKARLLAEERHPFFETLFAIYKNQGLPVGWIGGESADDGQFVVYARFE
ncbi:hypothetical protein CDO73_15665 [Saccharibacillus sp. O23]|uniref:hypothetical protein n=1 Tax=Saccharibacillus sp. O23 TaxID=2009338 RepID=UPI000B4E1E33|nr:hypothetical protein [Saccharibacillus sp. O23]OWR29619.1 hypothetical protein CDO73_15665 [Saccharibacillus sp. O23]